MTTKEALRELKIQGFRDLTMGKLRWMLDKNESLRPRVDSSYRFDWTSDDIAAVADAIRIPDVREVATCP